MPLPVVENFTPITLSTGFRGKYRGHPLELQMNTLFQSPIRKAYTGAEWNGPAQGLLNPVQEVTAAEKRVQNGFSTRDREAILRKGRRTKMYYCHPYTSCERGSNECANKMIRRKYPKGTDFNKVSRASIKETEAWINNYPREILGWKTSEIVFAEYLEELAREA